ncbi:MAG: hypothetical protein HY951_00985 [Bacteroidia bacterium]|nr:hypothetical protein [Bacteroidia bacterium]
MKKTFSIIIILCAMLGIKAGAQSFSSSPYSRFGIGDLAGNSFQPGLAMGGTGIALRSNHAINSINPASYTAFDTLSFIFDISVTGRFTTYKSDAVSNKVNNIDLSHFSAGFPVTKWWASSIGLSPYSNVGYDISDIKTIDTLNLENTYRGNGGINQFYIGNAFRLFTKSDTLTRILEENKKLTFYNTKSLSVGFNTSYYFGALERHTSSVFPDEANVFDMYTSDKIIINDLGFRFGAQYIYNHQEITRTERKNKYTIIAGFTFDNQNDMNAKNTSMVTKYLNIGGTVKIDTIENQVNKKGAIRFPMNVGVGFAYISKDRVTFALDYRWQQWSAARFFNINDSLSDSHTLAFGTQINPDPFRQNNYLKMIHYRLGVHYTKSYLNLRNTNITDYGFSLGFGLPLRKPDKGEVSGLRKKLPTIINVALEVGQRGTTANSLIKENYFQVTVNLSLYDIWFVKRRFN